MTQSTDIPAGTEAGKPVATLAMVNLDCPDPAASAAFYSALTGWEVLHSEAEYAMIGDGGTSIGFGRVPGYAPPAWPDTAGTKRFHLDFYVDDLGRAQAAAHAAGAATPEFQPGGDRWLVLTDPAGHPFCLCVRS
ncbi:MAG TPA: VOC family protein [Micromonosporaceae bacterium]|nr:VOC family protein [Micromonosporaceae bacterium]